MVDRNSLWGPLCRKAAPWCCCGPTWPRGPCSAFAGMGRAQKMPRALPTKASRPEKAPVGTSGTCPFPLQRAAPRRVPLPGPRPAAPIPGYRPPNGLPQARRGARLRALALGVPGLPLGGPERDPGAQRRSFPLPLRLPPTRSACPSRTRKTRQSSVGNVAKGTHVNTRLLLEHLHVTPSARLPCRRQPGPY